MIDPGSSLSFILLAYLTWRVSGTTHETIRKRGEGGERIRRLMAKAADQDVTSFSGA